MKYPNLEQIGKIFSDTSFFYALLNKLDPYHKKAIEIGMFCKLERIKMLTTWEIVNETITLLRTRYSFAKSIIFIEKILPDLELIILTPEERAQVLALYKKLSKDKELSLCDVISYFAVTKKLGKKTPCLSFDEDFRAMGLLVM